jgi:hypothetical protein
MFLNASVSTGNFTRPSKDLLQKLFYLSFSFLEGTFGSFGQCSLCAWPKIAGSVKHWNSLQGFAPIYPLILQGCGLV